MGRGRVIEELRHQARPRAGNQRVAVLEQDFEGQIAVALDQPLQLEQRGRVKNGYLAAEARRRDDKIDLGGWPRQSRIVVGSGAPAKSPSGAAASGGTKPVQRRTSSCDFSIMVNQ